MTTPEIERRRGWSRRMIGNAAGLKIPRYGSLEWLQLPEGSVAKVAAVVIAAEAWARVGDDLADDLTRELEQTRRVRKQLEDEHRAGQVSRHREQWRHLRVVPGALERLAGRADTPADLYDVGAAFMAERRAKGVATTDTPGGDSQ